MHFTRLAIEQVLVTESILAVREYPSWANTLGRMVREGQLVRVLPGIYAIAGQHMSLAVRALALMKKDPNAVITAEAAFLLFQNRDRPDTELRFYSSRRLTPKPGFHQIPRTAFPERTLDNTRIRIAEPMWAAVETAAWDQGNLIDEVFRTTRLGFVDLVATMDAFGRAVGNSVRRRVVSASRDEPWSYLERDTHQLLRDARITGWETNVEVWCGDECYYLDVAFKRAKLALEVDGFAYHSDLIAFHRDRKRQNALVKEGWTILRLTSHMLEKPEELTHLIRATLRRLERKNRAA